MRRFNYDFLENMAIPSDIVSFLVKIHELKGRQANFHCRQPDALSKLMEVSRVQSTGASSRIAGIYTPEQRLRELRGEHAVPINREEEEVLGYRTVLDTIHESHEYLVIKPAVITQLHQNIYKFSERKQDSLCKNANSVSALCDTYNKAAVRKKVEPLLLDNLFILDFLCIHPFDDGNGRMSRLLTLLLLYRHGYTAGRYISIESLLEKSRDKYHAALKRSARRWSAGENDFWPFIRYMLEVILTAYREFDAQIAVFSNTKITKEERIRKFADEKAGVFTKAELLRSCPDIAAATAEKVLGEMKREGIVKTVGGGRGTMWCKI